MGHELNTSFLTTNIGEQSSFKSNNDCLNKNESLEDYLNFYSSRKCYVDPVNFESNTLNIVEINRLNGDMEENMINDIELNNINDTEKNNLNIMELNNLDLEDGINASYAITTDLKEHKNDNINAISENVYGFEKDFKQKVEYYETEQINYVEVNVNKENDNLEIVNEINKVKMGDEENLEIKEKESSHQNYFKSTNEDKGKKDNEELNVSDKFPLGENEMMYNECALTKDFFETIENINTKVFEKYNNLKDVTENLVDIINKSDFEKRINNLLDLSNNNSELIDKFKKKSEDCIRQCRKFETTSENLIGECINTLTQASICYAEWVCLHSFKIDPIDNDLKDIRLFIENSQ
ncbi:conserved Plasmodium protein, unknown function [Plasmodium relictum]|uniref:Uncharacterized protein n=1 Tax=Plasmodium relictum TaxID=85471 RepID=A0A1J1H714_PLARL|nr:conserved Plasmodium protein, unknown function [Plasmodium relictum]CRH00572.1 conserved Plasmodium protein, unknown function [Plasmodium relictum]